MLRFDPDTGTISPATADIRETVRDMFIAAFTKNGLPTLDTRAETPAGQLIDSLAAIIADKDAEILFLANQFNPLTASGQWQAALGQVYFLTPIQAAARTAQCTCYGFSGTVIPKGSIIQCTQDNTQWVSTEDAQIPSPGSSIDVQFQCMTMDLGAVGANTLTKIVTVTPGWDSVTNVASSSPGQAAESQKAFEKRRYNSVAINGRGSVSALYSALASITGVVDCVVLENNGSSAAVMNGVSVPAHSVWITLVGGDGGEIAAAIYRNKDAGCGTSGGTTVTYTDTELPMQPTYSYQICRPSYIDFGVIVTIRQTPTTPADIEQKIKDAVVANFNGENENFLRAGSAQTIYASRFYADIISAGANDLVTVAIGTCRKATCTVAGTADTIIPANAQIKCTSDNTVWETPSAITIPAGGSTTATFICTTADAGTVAAGTLTQILTTTTGWSSVTNAAASTSGSGWYTQIDINADKEPVLTEANVTVTINQ